jgi:uncharacterized membrane-anchored protein
MRMPRIDATYWLALVAASTFGTNTGDFVAKYLHLGHLAGLPYMGLLFAAIVLSAKWARRDHALYFWAAIITMRTAATNVADAFQDFRIAYHVSVPLVLALFAASVLLYKRGARASAGEANTPVNSAYWVAMMLAGILGTVAGDFASFRIGLTPPVTAAVFGALILVSIAWFARRGTLPQPIPYWTTVALIRTGGTAAGDASAEGLGLALSTAATGLAFVGLVLYFYALQSTHKARPGIAPT